MKTRTKMFVWMCLLLTPSSIRAQFYDSPSLATNLGFTIGAPLNPTAKYASAGLGADAGIGYNLNRRNAIIGEGMWNWLYSTNGAIQPVRAALQSSDINGHGQLFALTANYRYELRGRTFGAYFICGGGWYYRWTSLSKSVPTVTPITCDPAWLWLGYNCSSGTVITSQTVRSGSSSAFGGNAGIGFTIRVGEEPYRFYFESRYHYAPTKNINTQLIAITVGMRY